MEVRPNILMGGRGDFGPLCDAKGLKTAIEVGTDRGLFAKEFLDKWHGELLYCVDPYIRYAHMPWNRSGDMHQALFLLAPHTARVRFLMLASQQAAIHFTSMAQQIGFIYIDGDHRAPEVSADLARWWPLVQPGGILAGDDFLHHPDVKAAVMAFAEQAHLDIQTVSDYNREVSWYFEKPPL